MEKIIIELEIKIPSDFDSEYEQSELRQLEYDVKEKFEEITGYSIINIWTKIETN